MKPLMLGFCLLLALVAPWGADAKLVRVEVTERMIVAGGKVFGAYGAYEKLSGTFHFEFDPDNAHNSQIVDLEFAPRNQAGRVEASANFMILQPSDPSKRRGLGFLEVSNRGSKASMRYFNRATTRTFDPTTEADLGDGLLMRQGLTVIWVGWQYDIPAGEDRLALTPPRATGAPDPIRGLVRSDWNVEQHSADLSLGHRTLPTYYRVADTQAPENVLTVRYGRTGPRAIIPRTQWRFGQTVHGVFEADRIHITMDGGFAPGIYELVYVAENPVISGIGPAVIRDTVSYAKHDAVDDFGVTRMLGFGVSQTGRFLRHFLYQDFNTDEAGRQVFDGLLIHTAGAGRGSFNHRFAQPSRDAHRFSAFFYPTDLFPFTSAPQPDPVTGAPAGLFSHVLDRRHLPKIFYTNTGYEYWGRAASLIHSTLDGARDTPLLRNERVYHLASGQHFVGRMPGNPEAAQGDGIYRGNPLEFLVNLRALVVRLAAWVETGEAPPDSIYPKAANGTLTAVSGYNFPAIPGITVPEQPHTAYVADYGPRWDQGIIDKQPPELISEITPRVASVDALGNEAPGVRNVELRVPLATFTSWNLRGGDLAPRELSDFRGSFIALPLTEAERAASGDPRPSLETLYKDKQDYLAKVGVAARALTEEGFLLEEDIVYITARMDGLWDLVHSLPRGP